MYVGALSLQYLKIEFTSIGANLGILTIGW